MSKTWSEQDARKYGSSASKKSTGTHASSIDYGKIFPKARNVQNAGKYGSDASKKSSVTHASSIDCGKFFSRTWSEQNAGKYTSDLSKDSSGTNGSSVDYGKFSALKNTKTKESISMYAGESYSSGYETKASVPFFTPICALAESALGLKSCGKLSDCGADSNSIVQLVKLDPTKQRKSNQLHKHISSRKWKKIRTMFGLVEPQSLNNESAPKPELKGLGDLVRGVNEACRTPLSLACGFSSAPLDIIEFLLTVYPLAAGIEDMHRNLPLHHFCHSFHKSERTSVQHGETENIELQVLNLLHTKCPIAISYQNSYGNLPLHIYVEHQCHINMYEWKIECAKRLLEWNPQAISVKNANGSLPLHYITKNPIKLDIYSEDQVEGVPHLKNVAKALIEAYPQSIGVKNGLGATPFFNAVLHEANINIWQMMLDQNPNAADMDNDRGVSPMLIHWSMFVSARAKTKYLNLNEEQRGDLIPFIDRNKRELSKIRCRQDLMNASKELIEFWNKAELMIQTSCYLSSNADPSRKQWRLIHSLCLIQHSHPDLLKFALQINSHEVEEADETGKLPLHIIAEAPLSTRQESTMCNEKMNMLLAIYSEGAAALDKKLRLPLHIAIANGKTWHSGVKTLLDANPGAIRKRNQDSVLYPFMLAAAAPTHQYDMKKSAREKFQKLWKTMDEAEKEAKTELERDQYDKEVLQTIFGLLRFDPDLISTADDNRKSITKDLQKTNYQLLKRKHSLHNRCKRVEQDNSKLRSALNSKEKAFAALQEKLSRYDKDKGATERRDEKPVKNYLEKEPETVIDSATVELKPVLSNIDINRARESGADEKTSSSRGSGSLKKQKLKKLLRFQKDKDVAERDDQNTVKNDLETEPESAIGSTAELGQVLSNIDINSADGSVAVMKESRPTDKRLRKKQLLLKKKYERSEKRISSKPKRGLF